jgi:hypothetical protein
MTIDIRSFVSFLRDADSIKPLPANILQGPSSGGSSSQGNKPSIGNSMGAFEAEKKYKKDREALRQDIDEKNREIES